MSPSDLVARPEWAPLLLLAPAVWLLLRALDRARARRVRVAVGIRLPSLATGRRSGRSARRGTLLALGTAFALLAALHPVFGEEDEELERRGVDLVLCLDVSRSMLARDLPPDRLARAKREIRSLAERAAGDRMALVLFAGEARLAVPLTHDLRSVADLADLAEPHSVGLGGTDLGAPLEAALRALEGRTGEHATVLLLTDGEDLGGRGLRVAEECGRRGIAVHCLGFGTTLGGKIVVEGPGGETFLRDPRGDEVVTAMDVPTLRRIAEATGGELVEVASRARPLVDLYEDRVLSMARRSYETERRRRRENRFQWPLVGAFALWVVDLGRTERRRR